MDYGLFRRFDKIGATLELPRTSFEDGLFLVELRFSPEGETRSVRAPMVIEQSEFGEIARVIVGEFRQHAPACVIEDLEQLVGRLRPPAKIAYQSETDELCLQLIDQPGARRRTVEGTLIFDREARLATLAARLR